MIEDFGPEAQAVIDRLSKAVVHTPLDRARAEAALSAHLIALGLEPLPVRWVTADEDDTGAHARAGFLAFWKGKSPSGLHATSPRALYEAERAAEKATKGAGSSRKAANKLGQAAEIAATPGAQLREAELQIARATTQLGGTAKAGAWVSDKAS